MGVTHIVIHPTSRLTLLLSRRVLSRAPPRAAFSGGRRGACSRAARPRPRRGPLAAPDWLCSGRQWPQPPLLLPPARGPYGWTPRAAAGAVAVEREAALSWIRIQVRCCCSELPELCCALCHGPTPLPRLTRPALCAACWLSVSIDTANLLWLAVVSLAAASLLQLLTVVAAATWRGVADGASRDEGLLQRSGGPATRLGSADPVIGPSRSVEESGGARARRSRSP